MLNYQRVDCFSSNISSIDGEFDFERDFLVSHCRCRKHGTSHWTSRILRLSKPKVVAAPARRHAAWTLLSWIDEGSMEFDRWVRWVLWRIGLISHNISIQGSATCHLHLCNESEYVRISSVTQMFDLLRCWCPQACWWLLWGLLQQCSVCK